MADFILGIYLELYLLRYIENGKVGLVVVYIDFFSRASFYKLYIYIRTQSIPPATPQRLFLAMFTYTRSHKNIYIYIFAVYISMRKETYFSAENVLFFIFFFLFSTNTPSDIMPPPLYRMTIHVYGRKHARTVFFRIE